MKCGVEAGDLRNLGNRRSHRADRRDMVRLMQWRERGERLKRGDHPVIDNHRFHEFAAAMDPSSRPMR